MNFKVIKGDITTLRVDAIVNAVSKWLDWVCQYSNRSEF